MSKPVIALVALTLLCGTASAYLWKQLADERAQTQTLQARVAQLEQQATSAALQSQPTPAIAAEPPSTPEPNEAVKASTPKPTPPGAATFAAIGTTGVVNALGRSTPMDPEMQRRMKQNWDQQQRLMQDPEYRELMRSQQKMSIRRMHGDLEVMLGLSKEEADRVREVLAEQQVRMMDQRPPMNAFDGSMPDEAARRELHRFAEESRRKQEAELASVLGPKYGEWQQYQQNAWSRSQIMRLRQTLATSDEPLRQDQIKPLVQALASEQQQMQMNTLPVQVPPGGRMTAEMQLRTQEEWLERTAQSHERIRHVASNLLMPAQMQQLQEQQDQERKMQELNLRMQRARLAEAQARGEDPSTQYPTGFVPNVGMQ
jgi:hypothetical protein